MIKKFDSLGIGDKFKIDNIEYEKIQSVKISCCQSVNAKKLENNTTIFIVPNSDVEVAE